MQRPPPEAESESFESTHDCFEANERSDSKDVELHCSALPATEFPENGGSDTGVQVSFLESEGKGSVTQVSSTVHCGVLASKCMNVFTWPLFAIMALCSFVMTQLSPSNLISHCKALQHRVTAHIRRLFFALSIAVTIFLFAHHMQTVY